MYHALTIGLPNSLFDDLSSLFHQHYLQFIAAVTPLSANRLLEEMIFHLVIVDLEYLRNIQEFHWLSSLRHNSFAPLVVLSDAPEQDLAGMLDIGADICVSRKLSHKDIAELAYAQFRRYTEYNHYDSSRHREGSAFQKGDILIDPARHTVEVRGHPVDLRPREFSLLLYFMRNSNIVLSSEQICEEAWGMEGTYDHGVAQPVRLLRLAIEPAPENPIYIHTVRRVGYRFVPNDVETCEIC